MPRLTDPLATERPTARAIGGIVQIREVGPGGAIGQGLQQLGAGIESGTGAIADAITEINRTLTTARRSAQISDALGKAMLETGELELEFQRDHDFKTAPTRFANRTEEIRKRYESTIDDAVVRGAFTKQYNRFAQTRQLNVLTFAIKQEADYNTAALDDHLDVFANAASGAANPAERAVIMQEAQLSIERMRQDRWITNVDAGNRSRKFLEKVDTFTVLHDMQSDPSETAVKLGLAAEYAPNLDPVVRERMIDNAIRQAQSLDALADRQAERLRKAREEETMKQAFELNAAGNLTRDWIDRNKAFVGATEYKAMLKMLDPSERKDDPTAYASLERLIYAAPESAERNAFRYHREG
ncbi:MAG: hypothetical protein ACREUQ_12835, partial [Burkholderiales bacterium]